MTMTLRRKLSRLSNIARLVWPNTEVIHGVSIDDHSVGQQRR